MIAKKTTTLERLKQVAAKAFQEKRFEEVSVARIAADSHCSTALIYEIYGSKIGLFREISSSDSMERAPPHLPPSMDGSMRALLTYANERLDWLAHPSTLAYVRFAPHHLRPIRQTMTAQNQQFIGLRDEVQRLMDAGFLRRADARAVTYSICAGVGFDPMAQQMMLGGDVRIDNNEVLRLVFNPLVTRKGAKHLEAFLSERAPPEQDAESDCVKLYDLI